MISDKEIITRFKLKSKTTQLQLYIDTFLVFSVTLTANDWTVKYYCDFLKLQLQTIVETKTVVFLFVL